MKKYFLLIFIAFCFAISAINAEASFYNDYLEKAINKCPGFIGGSSQLEISTPFSRWSTGQHRFKSTCLTPFRSNRDETSAESKEGNPDDTPADDTEHTEEDNKCIAGSVIRPNSGSVGEFLSVSGAPFSLMYSTDRVKGRKGFYQVDIPVHDSNSNVEAYNIYSSYAGGREIDLNFKNDSSSLENKVFTFIWDGKDVNGDVVLGSIEFDFTVTITAHGKDIPVTYDNVVGTFDAQTIGFGLWTPSIYHFYDVARQRLFRGSGTTEKLTARTLGNGDLMIAASDESEFYVFDSSGKHLYTKYGLTGANKYTFNYNGNNELISITGPYSQTTTFTRVDGLVTEITAPKGQVSTLSYDSNGYLQSIVNESNEKYEMDYYEGGLIRSYKKPEGQSSHFYYNESGSLVKDLHSSGYYTDINYGYDGGYAWNINTTITPSGYESTHWVDNITEGFRAMNTITTNPLGFETSIRKQEYNTVHTYPTYSKTMSKNISKRFAESAKAGGTSQITIEGAGTPTYTNQSVDFNDPSDPFDFNTLSYTQKTKDKISTSVYDNSTKTWTTTSAEGRQSTRTINDNEQTTSIQVGDYVPTFMGYQADGRVAVIEQGDRKTKFVYDENGYVKKIINALGQVTQFENDEEGRVINQTTPDGRTISFEYDQNGKQKAITPPDRPAHSFLYNAFEEMQAYVPPELSGFSPETTYQYNRDKQLTKVTRPDGQVINYDYDSETGLLETILTSYGNYGFTYNQDVNSIATSIYTDAGISMSYTYHGPLVASETQIFDAYGVTLSRKFDDEHRIRTQIISSPTGSVEARRIYDKDNLMTRNGPLLLNRANSQGLITSVELENAKLEYVFDSAYGELTSIKYRFNGVLEDSIEYQRDRLGRIAYEAKNGDERFFVYDEAGRFIGSKPKKEKDLTYEYVYDDNGNRIKTSTPSGDIEATYDDQDRLLAWGDYTFTYNENGDLTSKTDTSTSDTTTYQYDAFGNLRTVVLPDSTVIAYRSDPNNRRVTKKKDSVLTNRFIYESQLRVVAEVNSSNEITKQFLYGDSPNSPDAMVANGEKYLFVKDNRGSVRRVINSRTGSVAQEIEYSDWGEVLSDTNPGFQPFGFAGGLYDHETGLVRFGARDYDAEIGRWLGKDKIGFNGGSTSFYAYSMNDSINKVDFDGAKFVFATSNAAAALGASMGRIYATDLGRILIESLQESPKTFTVGVTSGPGTMSSYKDGYIQIRLNDKHHYNLCDGRRVFEKIPLARSLTHEFGHAFLGSTFNSPLERAVIEMENIINFPMDDLIRGAAE